METASLAIDSDPAGLDQLLLDIKGKPMSPHALQQHAVLAFGRRTNAQPPLSVLLQDAVALVGEVLHAPLGGVGEVRGETLHLTVAARDDEGRGAAPQEHVGSLADADSMAAFALKSGNVTVAADLGQETRFRDNFLRSRDVVGALTVPLHVNAKPFGVLGAYTREPREFSADDLTFAETIAHLLSASVARLKAEEKLREAHEIKSSLLGMVDSMVMTLDSEGRVVDMNRACEELTKFRLEEVRDRPFWQAMVTPDDADLVRTIFRSSCGSQIPSEFEGEVLARDGVRRRVSWSLKVLSTGQVQTILVTGRDRSDDAELKAELQRMKSLAEETTAALTQLTANLDKRKPAAAVPATPALPPVPQELDAEFEASLATLPPRPPTAAMGSDQRRSPRRAYRYRQGIAPMNEHQLPPPNDFFDVEFWDLSACGFSFFSEQLPKFETLVAALGRPPSVSHFSARVMRVARMTQDNNTRYLVGCDFINRVHLPRTRV
jgi:PAS domain S-box-containing protein